MEIAVVGAGSEVADVILVLFRPIAFYPAVTEDDAPQLVAQEGGEL